PAIEHHYDHAGLDRDNLGTDEFRETLSLERMADRGRDSGEGRFAHREILLPHARRARRADCAISFAMGQDGMSPPEEPPLTTFAGYRAGLSATGKSVFSYVLFGTYIGIGALSHDFGFSIIWALACTVLVWAGPAQVI